MHGALSGGVGDLCQQELKAPADSREATAFMSKQRERIANVRFTSIIFVIRDLTLFSEISAGRNHPLLT